jgi:hypothetical protein
MTLKKSAKEQPPKQSTDTPKKPRDKSSVLIQVSKEIGADLATARTLSRPEIGAAAIMEKWSPDTYDVNVLADELAVQVKAINRGDMQRTEGMLLSQAHALDAIFVNLMRRSMAQTTMMHWEAFMRMGMKAQSQCRATLQVLAEIKNPRPVAFVKQANISNGGNQQVNNGQALVTHEKRQIEQSKLLVGVIDGGKNLDIGTTRAPSASDRAVEAMASINRPPNRRRKGKDEPQ